MLHLIKIPLKKTFFYLLFFFTDLGLTAQQYAIKIPIIIDTDSANEIDDLFALVRVLGEPRFQLLGISSAQFHQSPYATTDTALESHKLNQELLELLPQFNIRLVRGSAQPLKNIKFPQQSEASDFIIQQAKKLPKEQKLHLIILGSCTNIASALIQAPEIVNKLQVYYIGFWHDPVQNTYNKNEFNTNNDPKATNFLLDFKGLDFRIMSATTCQNLVFEKDQTFKNLGENPLGLYLKNRWLSYKRWWTYKDPEKRKWIMWDISIIEALAHPEWTEKKFFLTPKENLTRKVQIYTFIDTLKMKNDFWQHYNRLLP